jgi:hypothetical protein
MRLNNNPINQNIKKKKLTQREVDLLMYAMERNNGVISPIPNGFIKIKIDSMKNLRKYNKECEEVRELIAGIYKTGILVRNREHSKVQVSLPVQYLFCKLGRERFLEKYVEIVQVL